MLFLENAALEDFSGKHYLEDSCGLVWLNNVDMKNPNAVVVGLAPTKFTFPSLNEAFRLLLGGAKLIAIHKGRYYRQKDGLSLGPGPFVEALEYAADVKSQVVGKPERAFFLTALASIDDSLTPQQAIMIGDDVRDDVLGAINAGMHAILVKTGKYCEGDELKIPEASRNCVESFVEAVDLIEKNLVK
uniref:Haloacid dehalogenase-like hydrolase domain-containing protein 2 n=1 Tax=Setaria digitata TaxID=48799 RepID=A0A915Q5Q1_9BILA